MTDNQWDLLVMHGGMMMDGMSSEEAIVLIMIMDEPIEDVTWLIEKVKGNGAK